jgi:hypothetical protein
MLSPKLIVASFGVTEKLIDGKRFNKLIMLCDPIAPVQLLDWAEGIGFKCTCV